jgi:excisionase family DNA binding protein
VTDHRATDWDSVPLVLDFAAAGRLLGLSRNSAYAAVAAGELPSLKVGRRVLVPRDRLRAMLDGTEARP